MSLWVPVVITSKVSSADMVTHNDCEVLSFFVG